MKTAVIYKSLYGWTEQYAKWIAQDLGADLIEEARVGDLSGYHALVFGGGLYASGVNCAKLCARCADQYPEKKLAFFTVGFSSTGDPTVFQPVMEQRFTPQQREQIAIFHLRGGMDYQKMSVVHRAMMAMMKKMVAGKAEKTQDDKDLLETYGQRADFSDRASIGPLVAYIQGADMTSHVPTA